MKLVFLLQRNSYFVEQTKAWYRVETEHEISLALALLPLSVVDEFELIEQPHQRGFARLHRVADDRATLALVQPDGTSDATHEIAIDERCLVHAAWLDRKYRDGWMPADARIEVEGVRHLSLRVYLPGKPGAAAKTLTVRDETAGTERVVELARDAESLAAIVTEPFAGKRRFSLRCEPETVNDSSDIRPLGFVLVAENIEATVEGDETANAPAADDTDPVTLTRAA